MSTVQVLCPNGRRQNVRITPNTKILQILEEVCQKQKFLPTEDYNLIHGRKTLDVTLSVRYANLANNAKLELIKSPQSREEKAVTVALQLESGERLQHTFDPTTSLWELLLHWENQTDSAHKDKLTKVDSSVSPSLQPSCIYMREEVIGELALRETRLRTLGLTGGKVVIRLTHRPVDEDTLKQINEKIEREKQRKAKLEQKTSSQYSLPSSSQNKSLSVQTLLTAEDTAGTSQTSSSTEDVPVPSHSTSSQTGAASSEETRTSDPVTCTPTTQPDRPSPTTDKTERHTSLTETGKVEEPESKMSKTDQSEEQDQSHDTDEPMEVEHLESHVEGKPMDVDESLPSGSAVSDNQLEVPPDTRPPQPPQNEHIEHLRALNIPGVEIFTPQDFLQLSPQQQELARQLMRAFLPSSGSSGAPASASQPQGARPKDRNPKKLKKTAPFSDFKFPEDTKGKNLYSNELSSVKKEDFRPCDRQTVIYSLEESVAQTSGSAELPDDFFELTEKDLKRLMSDQKKKLEEMEDQPLMTSAMRHQQLEAQYERYDKVVIRVQFPDRHVLQGMFRPRETVFAVQKFVKEYLEDKSTPFYLYTAPPKHVLKDVSLTMIEAKLVPASVVYFGSEQSKDHYLSTAVMSELSSRIQAEQVVSTCFSDTQADEAVSSSDISKQGQSSSATRPASKPQTSGQSSSESQGKGKPVPKWFKVGKK